MKMSGRVTSCCVALLLVLNSVSAIQRLNSIDDLKRINFGQSVPRHSLVLLHWFANTVDIDRYNNIRLNFNPNSDYGSHYYSNFEGLFPPGYRYYSVGSLNRDTSGQLPGYVVNPLLENGENQDRIIIGVQGERIEVYITQHYGYYDYRQSYDLAHTYQITTNLLRQIRDFSVGDNQMSLRHLRSRYGSNADDSYIRCRWGNLACLGLFLFIVTEEEHSSILRKICNFCLFLLILFLFMILLVIVLANT